MKNGIKLLLSVIVSLILLVSFAAPGQGQAASLVVSPASFDLGEVHPNKDYTRSLTITNVRAESVPNILVRVNTPFIYFERPDSGSDYSIPFVAPGVSRAIPFTLALPDSAPVGVNQDTITLLVGGEIVQEVKVTYKVPLMLTVSPGEAVLQLQQGQSKSISLALKNTSDTGVVKNARFSLQVNPQEVNVRNFDLIKQSIDISPAQIPSISPHSTTQNMRLAMAWDKASSLNMGKYPITIAIVYDGVSDKEPIKVKVNIRLVPEDIDWDTRINSLRPIEVIPGVNPEQANQTRSEMKRLADLIPERPSSDYYDIIKPILDDSLSAWEGMERTQGGLKVTKEAIDTARKALPAIADKLKRITDNTFKTDNLALRLPMQNVNAFLLAAGKKLEESVANTESLLVAGAKEASYQQASQELDAGSKDYEQAIKPIGPAFTLSRSEELYASALKHLDKAIEVFGSIPEYKDSPAKAQQAKSLRTEAANQSIYGKASLELEAGVKAYQQAIKPIGADSPLNISRDFYDQAFKHFDKAVDFLTSIAGYKDSQAKLKQAGDQRKESSDNRERLERIDIPKAHNDVGFLIKSGDLSVAEAQRMPTLNPAILKYREAEESFAKARAIAVTIPENNQAGQAEAKRAAAEAARKDRTTELTRTTSDADGARKVGDDYLRQALSATLLSDSLRYYQLAKSNFEKARDGYAKVPDELSRQSSERNRVDAETGEKAKTAEIARSKDEADGLLKTGTADLEKAKIESLLIPSQDAAKSAKKSLEKARDLYSLIPSEVLNKEAEDKRKESERWEAAKQGEIDRANEDYKVFMADGNAALAAAATGPLPTRQGSYQAAKGHFDLAQRVAASLPEPSKTADAESKRQAAETGEKNMQSEIRNNRSDAGNLDKSGLASFETAKKRYLFLLSKKYYEAAITDLGAAVEKYSRVGDREDIQKARELQDFIPIIQARMALEQRLQTIYFILLFLVVAAVSYWNVRRYMEMQFVAREVEIETRLFSQPPTEGKGQAEPGPKP